MLSKTDGTATATQEFDLLNRMTSYNDGTTAASYAYSPDNMRMGKTVNGAATSQVWAGG